MSTLGVIILSTFLLLGIATAELSTCMNGIQEMSEECDDGNKYNADGCSIQCLLEDDKQWLCNTTYGHTTICCPLLRNPVTHKQVCDCSEETQPDPLAGFTITKECHKRDINECNTNNGDCHIYATCTNFNVVIDQTHGTHECECRGGLIGDGVIKCEEFDDIDEFDD